MEKTINNFPSNTQGSVNLDKLQKGFGKSKSDFNNIPNQVGYSKTGAVTGTICAYLPTFAQENGLTKGLVHNKYKQIKLTNSMGLIEDKVVFRGFYLYTYVGQDAHGRPVIDQLHFYDEKYNGEYGTTAMTFEAAIADIERAAQEGNEPVGPARKLWSIAIENGFNHPLEMLQHTDVDASSGEMKYPEINYAQITKKFSRKNAQGYYTRRLVVSLSYYNTVEKEREDRNSKAPRTVGNYVGQANRERWNKSLGLSK